MGICRGRVEGVVKMNPASRVIEDLEDELGGKSGSFWCCCREAIEESEVGVVSRP